mgnify:CR=1 FL=1
MPFAEYSTRRVRGPKLFQVSNTKRPSETEIPGENIIFNGPGKSEAELLRAVNEGAYIHIDHFDEFFLLAKVCQVNNVNARVAIRVNMDVGIYPKWDRFGFNFENGEAWDAINRIMANPQLKLVGLHAHIGTYIMTTDAYRIAAAKLSELAASIALKFNHFIAYIDMGGNFASRNTLRGAYLSGVVNLYPFNYYSVLMLGWTNYQLGKTKEAKILFQKALLYDPTSASA